MKVKLLIAATDSDYATHLGAKLAQSETDVFDVALCTDTLSLERTLAVRRFDVILAAPECRALCEDAKPKLTLTLYDELDDNLSAELGGDISAKTDEIAEKGPRRQYIRKYQRISAIESCILGIYSQMVGNGTDVTVINGRVIAVWSPAGGVGKTTVALAGAAGSATDGMSSTYLNLEHFSGNEAFFSGEAQSISALFERLDGNICLAAQSVRTTDRETGIYYFGPPENYDDINELTPSDAAAIIKACASISEITYVDLPQVCGTMQKAVFAMADKIIIVVDGSDTCQAKTKQFLQKGSVYDDIAHKTVFVSNKGCAVDIGGGMPSIILQNVAAQDPISIYKSLSSYRFV